MRRGLTYYKERGRRYEFKVRRKFLDAGWHTVRSAASHGLWDIVAIHPKGEPIYFVQVKCVNAGRPFRDENWGKLRSLGLPPGVFAFGMVFRADGREPLILEFRDRQEESIKAEIFWQDVLEDDPPAYL